MRKICSDKVYSVHPLPNGFVYSYLVEQMENELKVGYKMVSFDTDKISNVTKNIYMLAKFGAEYKTFISKIKNYLTCFSIPTEEGKTFVIEQDGTATLYGALGEELWQEKMLYQSATPGGVAVNGNTLWVSYPNQGVLVRHNLKTLRQELRIGGENSPFSKAKGLFPAGSKLFICSQESNAIWKLDTSTYQTELYYQFDEPIYDYKFINRYEIAVLKSGIYLL
jgi:hypothetical protein